MAVHLLGDVRAVGAGGESLDVGPPKCRAVLAALAASVGSPVPSWRLIEIVWGDEPPRTAERTLQSYIARLRRALGPDSISRSGSAYRLDLPAAAVDVARFEQSFDAGDVAGALGEWTGTPLGGLEVPGLGPWSVGLVERWLGAVEMDLGERSSTDPSSVIGELTELTATHPFREELWAMLMLALYRVGRQADALAAYRTARRTLVEELGVEPGPRLQALELSILDHESTLDASAPSTASRPERPTGTVTFAFGDVESGARSWDTEREEMTRAMGRIHEVAGGAAARLGGHVFVSGGDTVAVAFPAASDALAWCREVQTTGGDSTGGAERLRVKIGVHSGDSDASEVGYFGPAVNLAAGLAAAANGGQTLVSEVTASLAGTDGLGDLGTYRLDEAVAMQRIFQVGDADFGPLRLARRRGGNLPRRFGPLVGRDDELTQIASALAEYPVVTLVGTGGIGKTRLAVSAAALAREDRETWFVDLTEVESPVLVPRAVADVLGVVESPGRSLMAVVVETLEGRDALIVLDNCEHLLDAAATFAGTVTERRPGVTVLATSRERLGLPSERIVVVPPLDPDEAVDLFDERARSADRAYDESAARPAVLRICRRLDGIPLAVELAAARVTGMDPEDLASRLEQGLHPLGSRRGRDRHRTLEAAIQWSYDLLEPDERRLFQQLSVLVGTFDLSAVQAIVGDGSQDVGFLLADLVGRSMVSVQSSAIGRRYRMLEPIREFASRLLRSSGQADDVSLRHAEWCREESERIGDLLRGWHEDEGVQRLAEFVPNLRAALDWYLACGRLLDALELVRPTVNEIMLRSHTEVGDWLERIATAAAPGDEDVRPMATAFAAHRYTVTHDPAGFETMVERLGEPDHVLIRHARAFATDNYAELLEWAPQAAEILRGRGWDHAAARTEIDIGAALLNLGRLEEHDEHISTLAERFRRSGPPTLVNWTLMLLGYSALFQGRPDSADDWFEQAIAIDLPARTHTPTGPLAARAAFRRGDRTAAFEMLADHIAELLEADNMQAASIACVEFINMMASVGELEHARRMLGYLESTGLLDASPWRTLVAEASDAVQGSVAGGPSEISQTTDRDALAHMRDTLLALV